MASAWVAFGLLDEKDEVLPALFLLAAGPVAISMMTAMAMRSELFGNKDLFGFSSSNAARAKTKLVVFSGSFVGASAFLLSYPPHFSFVPWGAYFFAWMLASFASGLVREIDSDLDAIEAEASFRRRIPEHAEYLILKAADERSQQDELPRDFALSPDHRKASENWDGESRLDEAERDSLSALLGFHQRVRPGLSWTSSSLKSTPTEWLLNLEQFTHGMMFPSFGTITLARPRFSDPVRALLKAKGVDENLDLREFASMVAEVRHQVEEANKSLRLRVEEESRRTHRFE